MSDDAIVDYAKAYCVEKGITKSNELQKGPNKDNGLYLQLRIRKLIDQVFERKKFEEMVLGGRTFRIPLDNKCQRHWKAMTPEALIEFAKAYCEENEVTSTKELAHGKKSLSGLYEVLKQKKRDGVKLIEIVFPRVKFKEMILGGKTYQLAMDGKGKKGNIVWNVMTPEELVEFTKAYCKEKEVNNRLALAKGPKALPGLYALLNKKHLMDQAFTDVETSREASAASSLAEAFEDFGGRDE
jgi:hypothetical protein